MRSRRGFVNKYVGRTKVGVHDAAAMDMVERLGYLSAPQKALLYIHRWVFIEVGLEIAVTSFA